jgi:isopenicillin-N epimerase
MTIEVSRRSFLNQSVCVTLAASTGGLLAGCGGAEAQSRISPTDEAYWNSIVGRYNVNVAPNIYNLENGYYGVMTKDVMADYLRNIEHLNFNNTFYLRTTHGADAEAVRKKIAEVLGVLPEEIALTRGATEALQILITNYNLIQPGEVAIYSDLDYGAMQSCMKYLKDRRGANVVAISMPEPATKQGIIDAYAAAFAANPKTRLVLLTHVSHRTGMVIPVEDIAAMAKAKGIDVIVDAAHSWGQLDFTMADMPNVDFVGFNLHKWMGVPLGVGFLYIRKERVRDIDPFIEPKDSDNGRIDMRVHTGTTNIANMLTVPAALNEHVALGADNKQARLRYLRDYWVSRVRGFNGMNILTPDEPGSYGAITSFALTGKRTAAETDAVVRELRDKYKVFTVRPGGPNGGECVRVSPALYNTPSDLDQLVAALKAITQS